MMCAPKSAASESCAQKGAAQCAFQPVSIRSGEHSVARCASCGLGITLPVLEDVASLYSDRESWDFQPQTRGLALSIKRIAFRRHARALLALVPQRARAIIDYGCGSGLLTSCIAQVSSARVRALDFHDEAPADLTGAAYSPFSQVEELVGSGDLLIASHVLEHANNPASLIERMARLVKPGGHLVFEVPNVECFGARLFGSHWSGWYLPFHRLHFSPRSLRAVAEQAGLTVLTEQGCSVPSMGRTVANLVGRHNSLFFILLGAGLHPLQLAMEWITRQPSALRIACRKPG